MGKQGNLKANERQSQVHVPLHSTTPRLIIQLDSITLLLCPARLAIQQAVVELLWLYFLSAQLSLRPRLHLHVHPQADLFAAATAIARPSVLAPMWFAYEAPHCMSLLGVHALASASDGPFGIWHTLTCKLPTKVDKQGSSHKVHASCIACVAATCQEGQDKQQNHNHSVMRYALGGVLRFAVARPELKDDSRRLPC